MSGASRVEASGPAGGAFAVPDAVSGFAGRILDIDAHESTPMNLWREQFGGVVDELVAAVGQSALAATTLRERDDTPITPETVWTRKSSDAPGAFDFNRRLAVLDLTGVRRQLIFPGGMGLLALGLYASASDPQVFRSISGDRKGYARALLDAYNGYCARVSAMSGRLRPVGVLIADTVDDLLAEARKLMASGVRAIWLPSATPPAGLSPADPRLDPLWDVLAQAEAPVLAHIGDGDGFLTTRVWRAAPAFDGFKVGDEFSLDPWTLSTIHLAGQNLVATLVMGGVFERHPKLRVGCCELGAGWVGPLSANLDLWHDHAKSFGQRGVETFRLKDPPSEHIRRHVRVAGFEFEDIGGYIRRYGLDDVYCYASDFPHVEGGKAPMQSFSASLAGFGPDLLRKFFTENGALLLPD